MDLYKNTQKSRNTGDLSLEHGFKPTKNISQVERYEKFKK